MSGEGRVWRSSMPLPGGGVAIDRETAAAVLFLVRYFLGGSQAVGPAGPLVRELRTACEVATRGMTGSGYNVRTPEADPPLSARRPDDLLTMKQVAQELNVDERTARRQANAGLLGPVTYAGRAKLVRRFEVDAYRSRRTRRSR